MPIRYAQLSPLNSTTYRATAPRPPSVGTRRRRRGACRSLRHQIFQLLLGPVCRLEVARLRRREQLLSKLRPPAPDPSLASADEWQVFSGPGSEPGIGGTYSSVFSGNAESEAISRQIPRPRQRRQCRRCRRAARQEPRRRANWRRRGRQVEAARKAARALAAATARRRRA